MVDFLSNPKIKKVGHTIESDMKELRITFTFPDNKKCEGFIDVVKVF